ncbi:MAG: carboxylating nicotinate-nucleotide diphosphorylase [Candidatus Roizmanbacteria bacterium]
MYENKIKQIINLALKEDIGRGDITSQSIFLENKVVQGRFIAKEKGVVAGLKIAQMVFETIDKKTVFKLNVNDGNLVKKGQIIAKVKGPIKSLLAAERTSLNFLQRMSGIASLTHQFVELTKNTKTKILDTRKTAPGLRIFDKWAVFLGRGQNHRFGLYDMVLIKDNHIKVAGDVKKAIQLVKKNLQNRKIKIEVEVNTLNQLKEAVKQNVNIIMLDNMNLEEIKKAVSLVSGKVKLEVSGGVQLNNVLNIAKTGVDYISVGSLTHSAKALDISLEI